MTEREGEIRRKTVGPGSTREVHHLTRAAIVKAAVTIDAVALLLVPSIPFLLCLVKDGIAS